MPNLEWKAVGEEPGCRQATMDPQIKLFGQTISMIPTHTGAGADAGVLNPTSAYTAPTSSQDGGGRVVCGAENNGVGEKFVSARSSSGDEFSQLKFKVTEGGVGATGAQLLCEEQSEGAQSDERDNLSAQSLGSDGKSLQKPDKVVACPRCNSQDTKFCYYNNYNVKQPRHFCKNCQRYWTAGGTLRNVPVGAGRRKNKAGCGGLQQQQQQQQQRENGEASPSCSSFQMESGEYSCGLGSPKAKVSHPKRLAGQGSPLRSPSTSFGQESGVTMSSPTYSLYQNGRLPFQAFNNSCSQGFTTSGAEVSGGGSSDAASMARVGQRLVCFPSGNGVFDKDCSRWSLSEPMQSDAQAYNASLRESSDTVVNERAVNNNGGQPMGIFNGEWPHGYNLDWDGKHQHAVVSLGVTVLTGCNNSSAAGPSATRSPAWVSTPWTSSNVSHPQVRTGIHQSTLGKRQGDRVEDCLQPAKTFRAANGEPKSKWPMLQGRSNPSPTESGTSKQLFQRPKLEPSGASTDLKGTFMSRLFNNAAAPRPVPFPVTI